MPVRVEDSVERLFDRHGQKPPDIFDIDDLDWVLAVARRDVFTALRHAKEPRKQVGRVVAATLDWPRPHNRKPVADDLVQPPLAFGLVPIVGPT